MQSPDAKTNYPERRPNMLAGEGAALSGAGFSWPSIKTSSSMSDSPPHDTVSSSSSLMTIGSPALLASASAFFFSASAFFFSASAFSAALTFRAAAQIDLPVPYIIYGPSVRREIMQYQSIGTYSGTLAVSALGLLGGRAGSRNVVIVVVVGGLQAY